MYLLTYSVNVWAVYCIVFHIYILSLVSINMYKVVPLERIPVYKGHKFLAVSTVNVCNAPSHQLTPLIRTELCGRGGVPIKGYYSIANPTWYKTKKPF